MHGCSTEYISVGLTKQKHKGQILLSTMAKPKSDSIKFLLAISLLCKTECS